MELRRVSENKAHVLVVFDDRQHGGSLASLLRNAGYEATLADPNTAPPPVDVVLVDVDSVLVSPMAGLQAQRRMGCRAPALLVAPRLSESMAAQVFELNIRDFLTKPARDEDLLAKIKSVLELTALERGQQEIGERLKQQDEALKRRLNELEVLSRVGRALTTVDDVDTVLTRIVDAAVYLTRAEEGALFMADERGELYVRAERGQGQAKVQTVSTLSQDSTATYVLETGQPIIRKGEEDSLQVKTGYLVQALVNVPIMVGNEVVGVLAVYNRSDRAFEEHDLTTLTALSDYATLALRMAEAIAGTQGQLNKAMEISRKVLLHTDTMYSPIESIESQLQALLNDKHGPLTKGQADALQRIRLAAVRLKEVGGFVRQLNEELGSEQESTAGVGD